MTSQAHAHINIAATESDDDSAQVSLARQINLFTNKLEPLRIVAPEIPSSQDGEEIELDDGIHVVQSENLSRVVVSGFGSFLSKKSERMVVKRPDERSSINFRCSGLSEVIVNSRGVGLSSDLIEELCKRGIRVSFLPEGGRRLRDVDFAHA